MTMPMDDGLHAMIAQVLAKQGEQGVQLAVIIEQLKMLPDHESRLRVLEMTAASDHGAGRVRAAIWASAAGVVGSGTALWVAVAHAR